MENLLTFVVNFYYTHEITILFLLMLVSGIGLILSWFWIKILWRARKLPPLMQYSNEVDKALACKGPYYEHGMVINLKTGEIKPTCKLSRSYFKQLVNY